MPKFDKTGPHGFGPMMGWGMGCCKGFGRSKKSYCGQALGGHFGFSCYPCCCCDGAKMKMPKKEKTQILKAHRKFFKEKLEMVEKELKEEGVK